MAELHSMEIDKQRFPQFLIRSFPEPPTTSRANGWEYASVYNGSFGGFLKLSLHVSLLETGFLPHDVHSHDDEEIFFLISGSLEVIKSNSDNKEIAINQIIEKNGFVYHSRNYKHTLHALGTSEAYYLVIRWIRIQQSESGFPPFCVTQPHPEPFPESSMGFQIQPVDSLQIKTNNRIRAHYSRLLPGAGYEAHKDLHDVLIIIFEGTVETGEIKITAPAVAFFASGFPHGLKNPGKYPTYYLVFEVEDQPILFL